MGILEFFEEKIKFGSRDFEKLFKNGILKK